MHDDRDDSGPPGPSLSPKTRAAEPRNATPDQRPHPAPPTRTSSKSHTTSTYVDTYKTDKMVTNDEHGLSTLAREAFAKNETSSSHHPHPAPTTRACSWTSDHNISLTKDMNKTDQFSQLGYNRPPSMMTESESPDSSRTLLSTFTVHGHPDFATHEGTQAEIPIPRDDGPDHNTSKGTLIVTESHNLLGGDPPPHPPGFPVPESHHSLPTPEQNKAHDINMYNQAKDSLRRINDVNTPPRSTGIDPRVSDNGLLLALRHGFEMEQLRRDETTPQGLTQDSPLNDATRYQVHTQLTIGHDDIPQTTRDDHTQHQATVPNAAPAIHQGITAGIAPPTLTDNLIPDTVVLEYMKDTAKPRKSDSSMRARVTPTPNPGSGRQQPDLLANDTPSGYDAVYTPSFFGQCWCRTGQVRTRCEGRDTGRHSEVCKQSLSLDVAEHQYLPPKHAQLGVPRSVAAVGAWNRGYRVDHKYQDLPSDNDAKDLTCAACGAHGHDRSRCTLPITGRGNDYIHESNASKNMLSLRRKASMDSKERGITRAPDMDGKARRSHETSHGHPLNLRHPTAPQGKSALLLEQAGQVLRFTLDNIPTGSYTENEHLRVVNYNLSITRSTNAKEVSTFDQISRYFSQFPISDRDHQRNELVMSHDGNIVRQRCILTAMVTICREASPESLLDTTLSRDKDIGARLEFHITQRTHTAGKLEQYAHSLSLQATDGFEALQAMARTVGLETLTHTIPASQPTGPAGASVPDQYHLQHSIHTSGEISKGTYVTQPPFVASHTLLRERHRDTRIWATNIIANALITWLRIRRKARVISDYLTRGPSSAKPSTDAPHGLDMNPKHPQRHTAKPYPELCIVTRLNVGAASKHNRGYHSELLAIALSTKNILPSIGRLRYHGVALDFATSIIKKAVIMEGLRLKVSYVPSETELDARDDVREEMRRLIRKLCREYQHESRRERLRRLGVLAITWFRIPIQFDSAGKDASKAEIEVMEQDKDNYQQEILRIRSDFPFDHEIIRRFDKSNLPPPDTDSNIIETPHSIISSSGQKGAADGKAKTPDLVDIQAEDRERTRKQNLLLAKKLPRSTFPCVHKPPKHGSGFLRTGNDYQSLGIPQHIARIGAWGRGNRYDYDGTPLPSAKEAKNLTCYACGEQGHDASRCNRSIMGSGSDYWELAQGPHREMLYERRQARRLIGQRVRDAPTESTRKGNRDNHAGQR
jgi:hypothetical protein